MNKTFIAYHGTDDEIKSFNDGITYFSDDYNGAGRYGCNIISVYLEFENPYIYDDILFDPISSFINDLKMKGYDGIISSGEDIGERYFITFFSKQIKIINH